MLPLNDAWLSWGAERLIAGSIQGAIAAAVVWVVCRRVTSMPPSVRALLWWLVSLKLLMSFASIPSLAVPVLPTPRLDHPNIVATDSRARRDNVTCARGRAAVGAQSDLTSAILADRRHGTVAVGCSGSRHPTAVDVRAAATNTPRLDTCRR